MKSRPVTHSAVAVHQVVKFIREERVRQGLTQKELGCAAKVSASAVQRFECGDNPIAPIYTLGRMLTALGYELYIRPKKGER